MADAERIVLDDDGEHGEITQLRFKNRAVHRHLSNVGEESRADAVRDALDLGAEVLARLSHHGDLDQLTQAVERLDKEGKRIVDSTVGAADRVINETVTKLTVALGQEDGPLAGFLEHFDPGTAGNVLDQFRDLVGASIAKATKQAVSDLAEATQDQVDSLTRSLAILEKAAAIEEARLEEAKKGTAKGRVHERDVESLLGDLVAVTGDGLDDVSTVVGLAGTKKGDKVIRPRGGEAIVTEEKCTAPVTEARARVLIAEAMENRGASVGMLIVDHESKVPGNQPYHLIDEDKVVVAAEPMALRLVYGLMRGKAIEAAQASRDVNDEAAIEALDAIRGHVDDLHRTLDRFKQLRTEHTKASKAISRASEYVDDLASSLAEGVVDITALIDAAVDGHFPDEEAAA